MSGKEKTTQFDKMTKTPISKLVLTLSIPSIISMLVTNIYNLVDTAFVGQLGTSASGAVGIVFGFMAVIQAFGFMFGQGAGSILSRALGAKDKDSASAHASAGFFSSFLFGIIISVVGFIWLNDIVMFLGSTVTIAPFAKTYIFYILLATPFMSSSLTLNNLLRYEGKASLGMVGLMAGAVLNMIGDPILMFGFKMGIAGAGLSTALSQLVSWGVLLWMFLSGKTETKISFKDAAKATPRMLGNIMATGFPSLLRQGLHSLTTVLLNAQCAIYGDAAVAAMSIVSRVIFFAFSIALGIGQGFQPVSAFNYGAGKYSRIRKGFVFTALVSEGIIVVGSAVLVIFSG
ncbi:MAG: MATE family efflux transporter, partial [Ruminococcus sp.]|nr:MATE family efflux transporter [Ruminococcus sp.]